MRCGTLTLRSSVGGGDFDQIGRAVVTTDCSVVTSYESMTARLSKRLREGLSLDLVDDFLCCDTNYGQRLDAQGCLVEWRRSNCSCWYCGIVVAPTHAWL